MACNDYACRNAIASCRFLCNKCYAREQAFEGRIIMRCPTCGTSELLQPDVELTVKERGLKALEELERFAINQAKKSLVATELGYLGPTLLADMVRAAINHKG